MKEERNINPESPTEEQEIDLIELAQKVWAERKLIFKWCGIAVIVGLIVAFSIPKEFSTSVILAPEASGKANTGGMGALAAMAGISMSNMSTEDALYPDLYPDIVASTPFLIELFDTKVTDKDGESYPSLYVYLDEHQRAPWWSAITSAPFQLLGWVISLFSEEPEETGHINPFMLTKDEMNIVEGLSERIAVSVDKKTLVINLTVTMQDPLISATLTDTVLAKLQNYITDYRTSKARHDQAFSEKLFNESRENYYIAQKKYANYVDGNRNVVLLSFRIEQERLQNEMNLAYGVYNQMAQQLQLARAKVQEITPVYTVVQPATVPLRASKPKKALVLIGFVFLAGVGSIGWILFIKDFLKTWKNKKSNAE